jgi:hypothetical protein
LKKATLLIYIIIFLIICIVPSMLTLFGVESQNFERRELASAPNLIDDGFNLKFTKQFDDYFSDNFALRPYFVTAYATLSEKIFKTSISEKVIIGKNGFLFFSNTLNSFTGQDLMTDEDLDKICKKLKNEQDKLSAQGKEFLFIAAPNKNTIYPENMPNRFKKLDGDTNMASLFKKMDNYNINYIDLTDSLIDLKSSEQIYHNEDSHWNNYGAMIAYNVIMQRIKILLPEKTYPVYLDMEYQKKNIHKGDLATMLYPSKQQSDMQIVYDMPNNYTSKRPIVSFIAIEIITENETQNKSALVFRDSFFNAQIAFFSDAFGNIEYTRKVPYDFNGIENKNVDIVILEIVERNLPLLIENLNLN